MTIHVVVGPPCAGKSTHVWASRAEGDLAVDFDRLAEALGAATPHDAEGVVREAAFAARSAAIRVALAAEGDSWVIHTSPTARQVERYVDAGATFLLLDPGEDECISRAEAEGRPERTEAAIRDWYASPPELPEGTVTIQTEEARMGSITPLAPRQAGADWCRIEAKAEADGETTADVYIYDEIGYWGTSAKKFAGDLAGLDVDKINLYVNSPGGSAWDGVAIMNALRRHRARVEVTVDGLAASAASLICMAGDHVTMNSSSQMMIHDASGWAWGNAAAMHETGALLDKLSDSYADAYAKRASGSREEWRDIMRAETWYTAEEAVLAGLADEWDGAAESKAVAVHSLSRFIFAGRDHAPAPLLPAAAAHMPPVSSEPGHTPEKEGAMPLDTLTAGLRERLGITDAEASEDAILAAVDALVEQATAPTPQAALPDGVITIEASVLTELQSAAADLRSLRGEQATERRAGLVEAAIMDGRIPPARRDHWLTALAADEEGMAPTLAGLAKGVIPLAEQGHSDDVGDADAYPAHWKH